MSNSDQSTKTFKANTSDSNVALNRYVKVKGHWEDLDNDGYDDT